LKMTFPSDKPAPFLICYGGWVGTDLPGEKWLIIGSAPKTPLSPVHEARQARGRTRSAWNDGEKVTLDRLQLQQGLGRALRSAEDTAQLIWPANAAFADLGLSETTGRLL
jgi:Rad3-related DNA helicase